MVTHASACAAIWLTAITSAAASDWPQWRGVGRDGISPDVPAQLPEKKLLWQKPLESESPAGVAAAGGLVVVACHVNGQDQIRCYKAEDGSLAWTHTVKNAAELQNGPGPRATPLIHEGRVYGLSAVGECDCLDLAKGTPVWNLNLPKEFKTPLPSYGHCGSLLIADHKLIVSPLAPAAAIAALDPATGKVLWRTKGVELPKGANSPPGQPHSSYIAGTFGEVVQIVGYDGPELAGWELATGRKLWSVKPDNSGDFNVGTPVNVDGKLLVATDNNFTRLYGFEKNGKIVAKPEALNDELAPGMATPVYHKGLIFGSGDDFLCLDPKTLKTLWVNSKEPAVMGFTMIIAGNERVLVFNEEGDLALLAARADKCELLGKMKVCDKTWSHPALADGKLYVRDKKALYCYGLK